MSIAWGFAVGTIGLLLVIAGWDWWPKRKRKGER